MSIKINNLTKKLKNNIIIDDISLEIPNGKCVLFTGRNGCGKTTLFKLISGLYKPSSGNVTIDDQIIRKDTLFAKNLSILMDDIDFDPYLTGKQNLLALQKVSKKGTKESIDNALDRVGLSNAKDKKYKEYSLGMKKRLAIAQLIFEDNDYLLADEPTNALDLTALELFRDIIKEQKAKNKTILLISHDIEDVEGLYDIKYNIDGGKLWN